MKQHTLSKTAERIYWLGRYLERAESTARLVNVNGNLLIDLPRQIPLAWTSLIDIMGNRTHFNELYATPDERSVVRYLTGDLHNPGSLLNSLSMARENARTIREIMPRVAFEYINDLYLYAKEHLAGAQSRSRTTESMEGVMRRVQHIAGFLSGTMVHGDTWSFLRIGEFLERADMTTRIIDVRSVDMLDMTEGLEPYSQLQWRSVLRSLHALQTYQLVDAGADSAAARTPVSVQERRTAALDRVLHEPDSLVAAYAAAQSETARRDQPRHPVSRRRRCRAAEGRGTARVHRRLSAAPARTSIAQSAAPISTRACGWHRPGTLTQLSLDVTLDAVLTLDAPSHDMRYIIEFLLPGTIVVIVALLLFRNRGQAPTQNAAGSQNPDASGTLSTGTFVLILIVGAAFTVALVYALHSRRGLTRRT